MAFYTFTKAKIKGICAVVPDNKINSLAQYESNPKKAKRLNALLGIGTKYVLSDENYEVFPLGLNAANILINDMKIDKNKIDALIYVNQKPDYIDPATAHYIHHKLGLGQHCAVFDITKGCVGFVFGLHMASALIESGAYENILLITADKINSKAKQSKHSILFGDAGTCTLISRQNSKSFFSINEYSTHHDKLIRPFVYSQSKFNYLKDNHKSLCKDLENANFVYLDGEKIFELSTKLTPQHTQELLEYAKVPKCDIKNTLIHQANGQIVKLIARAIDTKNASAFSFEEYGNTTINSIPLEINCQFEKNTLENGLSLMCAFGNGFSIANAIVDLSDIYLSGVIKKDIKPEVCLDDYIKYWHEKIMQNNQ